jgi:hypothetical protein
MAVALSTDRVEVNPSDLEATASQSLKQLGNLTMKSPNSQQSFHYLWSRCRSATNSLKARDIDVFNSMHAVLFESWDIIRWAHGVAVPHPLSMREALGSIPSVSICAQLVTRWWLNAGQENRTQIQVSQST